MPDWLGKFLDVLKDPSKYFFPIAVTFTAIIFLPDKLLEPIGLVIFRIENQAYFGIGFLFSWSVVACVKFTSIFIWARGKYGEHLASRKRIARLNDLTKKEKEILRRYLEENTRTLEFNISDGVVAGLVHAGILYVSVNIADGDFFPRNIQDWAWKHINAHPEIFCHATPKT